VAKVRGVISLRRKSTLAALITATVLLAVFLGSTDPYEQDLQAAYDDAFERGDPSNGHFWAVNQMDNLMSTAVKNLGTNALPVLVSWIESDSKPSLIQNQTVRKLGHKLGIQSEAFWRMAYRDQTRAWIASHAIGVFRGQADLAVPRLKELAKKKSNFAEAALIALGESP
jgi:hypothetical protein